MYPPVSYFGGPGFKFVSGDQIYSLKFFAIFPETSRQMPATCVTNTQLKLHSTALRNNDSLIFLHFDTTDIQCKLLTAYANITQVNTNNP